MNDRYQNLDRWKQEVRQHGVAYKHADDHIKAQMKDLKPYRQTARECSSKVIALMQQADEKRCDFRDHGFSLRLDEKQGKKMPSRTEIHERCIQWDPENGEQLAAHLLAPIIIDRTRLLRKKLADKPAAPSFRDSVDDILQEMEPPEDFAAEDE